MEMFEPWKAESILNFLDLDFDPAVRDWIVQNTGQAVPAQKGMKSNPMPSRTRRDLNLDLEEAYQECSLCSTLKFSPLLFYSIL